MLLRLGSSSWVQVIFTPPLPPEWRELSTTSPHKSPWTALGRDGGGGGVGKQVGNYRVPLHTTGCPDNCYVETCYVWPRTQRHPLPTRLLCAYSHAWWWWWGLCSPEVIFRCPQLRSSLLLRQTLSLKPRA